MAILFFEGFDRSTVTKDLDANYWSFEPQQPVGYRQYAFGGYSYDHTTDAYDNRYYDYYSPNNATLPYGIFQPDSTLSGNYYPGFGQPLGFLALHNLDISNNSLLAPITYLQISGFNIPQSGQSFLSTRILGIETKDTNYAASDKAGRFGNKHPIVAFCSGNTTGLILNIVKTTGNHIDFVENQRMTIGLEVEQNNAISGTFDLNVSSDVDDYKLKSVYSNETSYQSGDMIGRILTIDTRRDENNSSSYRHSPISRWCHCQFGIVQTGEPYIQIKVEDVDLLSIPEDDTNNNKDFWEDKIYISGFDYDNIRFFNRTYNGSIEFTETYISQITNRYYMLGSTTLIDDLILSDASGTPNNFLGRKAKVIPFTPGVHRNIADSGTSPDGPLEWDTNASSYRAALKNVDGDTGKISTSTPGAIAAIKYKNDNISLGTSYSADPNSWWRMGIEDAIGGMKVYTQAKKEFLDSSYEIIIATGDVDAAFINNVLLITNGDIDSDSVIDRTRKQSFTKIDEVVINTGITRFSDHPSIQFNNSYIYTNGITSLGPDTARENVINLIDDNLFTLESFVYFTGDKPITLFSTALPTGYPNPPSYIYSEYYEVLCYTGWIDYNYYVHDTFYDRVRLYFPESINTGEWNHVALCRGAKNTDQGWAYPLVAFLNGVSGTSFNRYQQTDYFSWIDTYRSDENDSDPEHMSQYFLIADAYYSSGLYSHIDDNTDLGINSGIVNINTGAHSGTLIGSGLFSAPITGTLTGYIPPYNNTTIDILDFDVNYSGNLLMKFQTKQIAGTSANPRLEILKNDILQIIGANSYIPYPSPRPYLSPAFFQNNEAQNNISVQSGDNIKIRYQAEPTEFRQSLKEFYLKSAYIGDDTLPVENSLYYLPSGAITYYFNNYFYSHPNGPFANFSQLYDMNWKTIPSNPFNTVPSFYGGYNIISDLRLTQGSILLGSDYETRYENNFVSPAEFLRAADDNYVVLGEAQTLTKTRYGSIQQFYQYNNPATQEPWTTGLVAATGGILLGVRKL